MGVTEEEKEARRALTCLYIAVESNVAKDVEQKVLAAFQAIREQGAVRDTGEG
jgi:hypothetical protein